MSERPINRPVPTVLAMILCDAIHQDPATNKCTILGTFSTINVRKFPAVHRQLAIHVALTSGHGKTRIKLVLAHAEEGKTPLFAREGEIDFPDPRMVAELNFAVRSIAFNEPGEYRVQVYANDELLMERRLYVFDLSAPKPPVT